LGEILTPKAVAFQICYFPGGTHCVIDGDTIDYDWLRVRMVDYDTPEIGEPKCSSEYELGQKAKHRLVEILNSGIVAVTPHGNRDIDQYGRKLRLVTVNGRSVGDTLIDEGLAVPWEGHRHYWCG
jgi:micrococcal nuclease